MLLIAALVFERQLHPGPVRDYFPIIDLHIQLDDFCDAQIAQRPGRQLHGIGSRFLPRFTACPNQLDNLVDTLRHISLLSKKAWNNDYRSFNQASRRSGCQVLITWDASIHPRRAVETPK